MLVCWFYRCKLLMICSGLSSGCWTSSSKTAIIASFLRFLFYSLGMSAILRFWFLLSAFHISHKRNLSIFIVCFWVAQVCSPNHFLPFALENFCCLIFPKHLIFFFCSCHYSFLKSLFAFFFNDMGAAKKLSKFFLVTIENYFQRPVFHRASLLFLLLLLFSEFVDFMWDFLYVQITLGSSHSRPHVSQDMGSIESPWLFCIHMDVDCIPFSDQ